MIKRRIEVVAGLEMQFIISSGASAVSIQVTTAPVQLGISICTN